MWISYNDTPYGHLNWFCEIDVNFLISIQMVDLLEIKIHQVEMMIFRGYAIPDHELSFVAALTSESEYNKLTNTCKKRDDLNCVYTNSTSKIYVYYASRTSGKKLISKDMIKEFISNYYILDVNTAIIISNSKLSSSAQALLIQTNLDYQFFMEDEFYINPTQHLYTPLHVKASESERKQILKELNVEVDKMSNISVHDAIVKYYGWKVGDLIKIYRDDSYVEVLDKKSLKYKIVTIDNQ